jgi:NADH-quinone oxidoreductase subunit K
LFFGTALFCLGLWGVITSRHAIRVLMSIELMLNAVNLALVAYNKLHPDDMNGHMFAFFIVAVAAAEAAVGLAIVLSFYRLRASVNSDEADTLKH